MNRLIGTLLAVGAMTAGLVAVAPASAATTNTDCSGLQAALNASSPGDTIVLNANQTCSAMSFTLPSHQITLTGAGNDVFDGNNGGSPILSGTDVAATTISNLLFKNSNATTNGAAIQINGNSSPTIASDQFYANNSNGSSGGAVYIATNSASTGFVTVQNSAFGSAAAGQGNTTGSNNCCTIQGGGLYVSTAKPLSITGNSFIDNAAQDGGGVGYDQAGQPANISMTGNTFTGNTATAPGCCSNEGGAFVDFDNSSSGPGGTATFASNNITNNQARSTGGGIYFNGCGQSVNLTVSNNAFGNNTAQYDGGGLILFGCSDPNTTWTLTGNTFGGNHLVTATNSSAEGAGAALFADDDISTTQRNNVFDSNTITAPTSPTTGFLAGAGEWMSGVALSSTNDRFTNNSTSQTTSGQPAEGIGAGAQAGCGSSNTPSTDPYTFTNAVFAGNSTPGPAAGAGLYVGGCTENVGLSLLDSTIAGNNAASGSALFGDGGDTLTSANSIISSGSGTTDFAGFGGLNIASTEVCEGTGTATGPGNICADPKLAAPGPGSANVHQTAASPTIDRGSNALVPPGLTTDFEGKPRIVAGRSGGAAIVDMGADEAPAGTAPAGPSTTPVTTTVGTRPPVTGPVTPRVFALGSFTFSNGTVKINRKTGVGFIVVSCHAAVGDVCIFNGALYINQVTTASTAAKKKAKTHRVKIGTVSGTVPGGKTGRLRVKLNKKGLALLKQKHSMTVTFVGSMRHRGPGVRPIRRHVKLKLG
jgi:hypothetical protein